MCISDGAQVYYDLDKYDWSDVQWTIDPENWFLSARINNNGLWRVAYPAPLGQTGDGLQAGVAENLRVRLPGHPGPEDYTIDSFAHYNIHQRCAEHMAVGRILLAGDAAHVNNPQYVVTP